VNNRLPQKHLKKEGVFTEKRGTGVGAPGKGGTEQKPEAPCWKFLSEKGLWPVFSTFLKNEKLGEARGVAGFGEP